MKKTESVTRYEFETPQGLLIVTCGPKGMRTRLIKDPNYVPPPKPRRVPRPSYLSGRRLGPVLPLANRSPLPLSVKPLPDEALLSWLLRLATHLDLSMHELAQDGFGVVDYSAHSNWWRRPRLEVLERIQARTGVDVEDLRRMTCAPWAVYRKDEVTERFCGRIYEFTAPTKRMLRWAVCRQCLVSDPVPYLRLSWLIGWFAVCPDHGAILVDRCAACGAKPCAAPFRSKARFSPLTCGRCGEPLEGYDRPACPSVARLQAALRQGKWTRTTELDGIGRLSWRETVVLADVVLGMFWTNTTWAERSGLWSQFMDEAGEFEFAERSVAYARYGSLEFLSWFLTGWPHSAGSGVAMDFLARWLSAKRSRISRHLLRTWADPCEAGRHEINPRIRERLRALYEAATSRRRLREPQERPPSSRAPESRLAGTVPWPRNFHVR